MEDEEIEVPNINKYELPQQHPRSEPPSHHAPIVDVREEDQYSPSQLSRTHLNAHQIIAAGKYIKRAARNYFGDPSWLACHQQAIEMFVALRDKEDDESVFLRDQLKTVFGPHHRTVAGQPQGESNV